MKNSRRLFVLLTIVFAIVIAVSAGKNAASNSLTVVRSSQSVYHDTSVPLRDLVGNLRRGPSIGALDPARRR